VSLPTLNYPDGQFLSFPRYRYSGAMSHRHGSPWYTPRDPVPGLRASPHRAPRDFVQIAGRYRAAVGAYRVRAKREQDVSRLGWLEGLAVCECVGGCDWLSEYGCSVHAVGLGCSGIIIDMINVVILSVAWSDGCILFQSGNE
jgi:hypothetical protein